MTRICEPTAFEKQAASLEFDALGLVDEAIGQLRAAERALLDEERQHGPHLGITNQYKLMAYADIISVVFEARRQIIDRLTGVPSAAA